MKIVDDDEYWEAVEQERELIDRAQQRLDEPLSIMLIGAAVISVVSAIIALFADLNRSAVVAFALAAAIVSVFAARQVKQAYDAIDKYPIVPPMRDIHEQAVPSIVFRHLSNAFLERSAIQAVEHVAKGNKDRVAYHNDNIAEFFRWLWKTSDHDAWTLADYVSRIRIHYRIASGQPPYNPVAEDDSTFIDAVFESLHVTLSLTMNDDQIDRLLKSARYEFDKKWA